MKLQEIIEERVQKVLLRAMTKKGVLLKREQIILMKPERATFGDYAVNVAMQTWQNLPTEEKKELKSPLTWAKFLAERLDRDKELRKYIMKTEVAGGGFINLYLTVEAKLLIFGEVIKFSGPLVGKEKVVVEYSSPNVAKSFTIGHLRSTIIGAAVANLLEATGKKVIRDNHLGDWGTQFGKQIVAIEKWGDFEKINKSKTPIKDLVDLYVKFHDEAKKNPKLEDEARAVFLKMEQGDKKYLTWWQKVVDISTREFNEIYGEMGIKFDENRGRGYGESFFRDKTKEVVDELEEKGLLKTSRGAKIVEFEKKLNLPALMVVKQDGSTLYATRDLATDKWRLKQYGAKTVIINEVGKEQSLYFKQLYVLEERLGWVRKGQRVHIGHGLYRFKGRKMSTRKGEIVWLAQIVEEAKQKVREMSKERLSEREVAVIAWGAIKWNDLVREPLGDIDFDLQAMLRLNGNSGAYMQYTAVRLQSILQKVKKQGDNHLEVKSLIENWQQWQREELEVVTKVNEYRKVKERAAQNLAPHILANYLFELAQIMNNFYAQKEILGNRRRELLVKVVKMVLNDGFGILGIQTPLKM